MRAFLFGRFDARESHVTAKLFGFLVAVALFALPSGAKPKPSTSCKAYVIVVEHDEVTVGLTMVGLNKPQANWYKKHGERKYAGVCSLNPPRQEAVDELPSKPPNRANPVLPVYAIVWGEHLVREPYTYSYTTQEQSSGSISGTITDDSGNSADVEGTTTTTVPVEHEDYAVKHYYVADGFLELWNSSAKAGKGAFVPIQPLHNHNRTILTSAATSILKDGLEQIAEREQLGK